MQRNNYFDSQCQKVETEYVQWCDNLIQAINQQSAKIKMILPPRLQTFHKSMHAKLLPPDAVAVVGLLNGVQQLQKDAIEKIVTILEDLQQNISQNLDLLNLQGGWKGIPSNHNIYFPGVKPSRLQEGFPNSPRHRGDQSPGHNVHQDSMMRLSSRQHTEAMWDHSASRHEGGKSSISVLPNGGLSSSGEAYEPEEQDDAEESYDEPSFGISNLSTLNQEPCFVNWERKFSPSYRGTTIRNLQISTPVRSEFAKRRLTSIVKHMGTKSGDMAIWVGGYKQMVGLFRNKVPLSSLEDVTDEKDPRTCISHIGYMSNYILFFTSHCHFIVMNIDGTIEFFSPLDPLLSRPDNVTASLSEPESSCTILGTNEGRLIVIHVDTNEKAIQGLYNEHHSARRISSLVWIQEQEKVFACSSFDKNISIIHFNGKELEVHRNFNYDQSVSCCIKMGSLLVAAFGNACISIIEPEQGKILTSLKLHRPKAKATPDYAFINWVGFLHLGTYKELHDDLNKSFKHDKQGFEAFLSRIRFVCKFDDNLLVVCGFPSTDQAKYKEVQYADRKPHVPISDSRRLPIVMERFDERTIRLRMFTIDLPENGRPSESGQAKPDDYVTWMTEVDLTLVEEVEHGEQQVSVPNQLSQPHFRGDAI